MTIVQRKSRILHNAITQTANLIDKKIDWHLFRDVVELVKIPVEQEIPFTLIHMQAQFSINIVTSNMDGLDELL